jgi:hypothetical protein
MRTHIWHRHCERNEAIHLAAQRKNGLLRCARNDVDKSMPPPAVIARLDRAILGPVKPGDDSGELFEN